MGMNQAPVSERIHIGIFGRRNVGKSSLMNAITNQNLAVVSAQKGTTTDPVYKTMEILPLGSVVFIDTPGLDDVGDLGQKRVEKSIEVLRKTDIALLVIDREKGLQSEDLELLRNIQQRDIPYLIVINKMDLYHSSILESLGKEYLIPQEKIIEVSAEAKENIQELRERIAAQIPDREPKIGLLPDLIQPLDIVVLVVPIDSAAPKGRLILPQQQTIRALLEAQAVTVVVKETELRQALRSLGSKPKLVITDSQAFSIVAEQTPEDILLTSFSVLFARYKGDLKQSVEGIREIDCLNDGDKVLIVEGCTHHRQCDDIGTVKIPNWLEKHTKKDIIFEFSSGTEFPNDLSSYRMIIHCGGCMLNEREMKYRLTCAREQNIPITNYGIFIAYVTGILKRSLEMFPEHYGEKE